MKILEDYSKEDDILSIKWGGKIEHSREIFNGRLILDFNKKDEVVGFELFGFLKEIKESDEKIKRLFESSALTKEVNK